MLKSLAELRNSDAKHTVRDSVPARQMVSSLHQRNYRLFFFGQLISVAAPRGAKPRSAFAIVITPLSGSGPLYAARAETQGQNTVVSIIPAISALTTISLPAVRDSYDAISP